MKSRKLALLCTLAAVAACNRQPAGKAGNAVMPSAQTQNAGSGAAPLSHEEALALMKQRHDNMEAMGKATKKAHNALGSSTPDLAVIRDSAARIDALAPKLQTWFPQGTGPDVGKTRAKPAIWQKPEDFAIKAHDLQSAADQFDVAARSGDMGQVKSTFEALGKSCKSCHDLYRAPEKH